MTDAASRNLPKILMIAYACNPEGGGEHWLGWGWAEQAAKNYSVHLITTPNARSQVEKHALAHGITPHFVEIPSNLRKLSERLGGAGSWWRKILWQSRVADFSKQLHSRENFQIVHQTTFHTFRVPFRGAELGIPSVWGPVAGGESTPPGFGGYLGPARFGEASRKFINQLWLLVPGVARSLKNVSAVFVSNRTTLNFLPEAVRSKCTVVSPNALRVEDEKNLASAKSKDVSTKELNLLYVGNCVHTRSMPIVFDALRLGRLDDCHLTVVGGGVALEHWKRLVITQNLSSKVTFTGPVTREKLPGLYAAADVLVFPALRDSGGSALLEAMSKGIPVICLDWGGPGEMVDDQSGVKIPVTTPEQTVAVFAEGLARLQRDPHWRTQLGERAIERARSHFTWEAKRRLLETTYNRLLERR